MNKDVSSCPAEILGGLVTRPGLSAVTILTCNVRISPVIF